MINRTIRSVHQHLLRPGFLGQGHLAAAIIDGSDFAHTDPFFMLMDDRVNLPGGEPAGGPHPHAGFETVTLVLKGDGEHFETGSLELMTAGAGVVHTEEINTAVDMRILQLWMVLPPEQRWAAPRVQKLAADRVPRYQENGATVKVYSGQSGEVKSPLKNYTPFTLLDIQLAANAVFEQSLPPTQNAFLYMLDGKILVGETSVSTDQSAWLTLTPGAVESGIRLQSDTARGARFILYAGQPHGAPVMHHGPFIGNNKEDILRLYQEYREGKMPHIREFTAA